MDLVNDMGLTRVAQEKRANRTHRRIRHLFPLSGMCDSQYVPPIDDLNR